MVYLDPHRKTRQLESCPVPGCDGSMSPGFDTFKCEKCGHSQQALELQEIIASSDRRFLKYCQGCKCAYCTCARQKRYDFERAREKRSQRESGWMIGVWFLSILGWSMLCRFSNGKRIWVIQIVGALLLTLLFILIERHLHHSLRDDKRETDALDERL